MKILERFGNTVQMIEQDGFSISARVPMNIYDDSRATIAKSLGRGIIGMVVAMEELNPDCMILIGDRYEMLAAGQADIYPRQGRTMEWDIAAGHAVLAAAGGQIQTLDGGPLLYGKPGFENPHFVACGAQPFFEGFR